VDLGLNGKTAVVLASSKGLGRATAEALAAEGCHVAMCARDGAELERAAEDLRQRYPGKVFAQACDVSRGSDLDRLFEHAQAILGPADILVNNAGGPPAGPTDAFSDAEWQAAFELNFMSVVRACRRVLPHMKQKRWGRILTIASTSVKQPIPGLALSNSFRAAVAGYSKTLATEVGPYNILVNCVLPGSFLTDRNRQLGAKISADRGIAVEDLIAEWEKDIPLKRMGEPLEFGRVMAFLASDRCGFITGACIPVDGGSVKGLY
jgi:3-oxoacyl-[acyl-carrier protein] reductase